MLGAEQTTTSGSHEHKHTGHPRTIRASHNRGKPCKGAYRASAGSAAACTRRRDSGGPYDAARGRRVCVAWEHL
jgi:hypothetical protein